MMFENKKLDFDLFCKQTSYRAYDYMGVHKADRAELSFRVWAPNAKEVYLVGDFNQWSHSRPMKKITENGIWEIFVSNAEFYEGGLYKYKIISADGKELYKADPYARCTPKPPETASVYYDIGSYEWHDAGWLSNRRKNMTHKKAKSQPINIYELHLSSWKKREDGSPYSYVELARELVPYVKQMGYTHINLEPITEYPYDGSCGYQTCSYYAPASLFGTPREFMEFVDILHSAGVGVILDFAPMQYSKDEQGLCSFDGQPIYEDIKRNEVQSFFISNVIFWLEKYHIDGILVDEISSMLFDGDAVSFFKKLNLQVKENFPDALVIAGDCGKYKNITGDKKDSLGFAFSLNKEWTKDTLSYMEKDPIYRKYHHNEMIRGVERSLGKETVLSVTHNEVAFGKRSLLDKMYGSYNEKFASERAFLGYMMTLPGKKLLFMGAELAQFCEWRFCDQTDWSLLGYERHAQMQKYVSDLNMFYLENRALWEKDADPCGFEWLDPSNSDMSIISYKRVDKDGQELYVTVNFTPVLRKKYRLAANEKATYYEVFNSDNMQYGGDGILNKGEIKSQTSDKASKQFEISINVPPLSVVILKKIK